MPDIPLPDASIAEKVKPPDPYSGKTARERYTKHQEDPVCSRVPRRSWTPSAWRWRTSTPSGCTGPQENGVTIDASGGGAGHRRHRQRPGGAGAQAGHRRRRAQTCFAGHWLEFAYGRTLGGGDECLQAAVNTAFEKAGYNVRRLLLALTQTDDFLYRAGQEAEHMP